MTIYNVQSISSAAAGLLALSGIVVFGATWEARGDSPALKFELTPQSIEPGARATLTLVLTGVGPNTRASLNDALLTESKDLTVLERSFKQEDRVQTWVIEITSYKSGSVRVPPLEITYEDTSFSSENRDLIVQSSRPENDLELRQEFGAVGLPNRWDLWGRMATWLFTVCAIAYCWYAVRKKIKTAKALRLKRFRETEAPQVWLKMRLEAIHALIRDGAPEKQVWTELASAVRGYFSRCSMNPVEAWTTGEFEMKLTRYPEARRLLPLLRQWDQRFTREKKPGEISAPDAVARTERILLPWTA